MISESLEDQERIGCGTYGYLGGNVGKSTRFQQCMSTANSLNIILSIGVVFIAKTPKLCSCLEFRVSGIHERIFLP